MCLFKGLGKGFLGLNKGWAGLKKVDLCLEKQKNDLFMEMTRDKKVTQSFPTFYRFLTFFCLLKTFFLF